MSNSATGKCCDGWATVSPMLVDGNAKVYIDIPAPIHFSVALARELAAALTAAADASERQKEIDR